MIRSAVLAMRKCVNAAVLVWMVGVPASVAADERGDAQAALAEAEAAVAFARAHRALWTTAVTALHQSRSALERGDFAAAQRWGREARLLSDLGLEQAGVRPPDRPGSAPSQ